MHTIVLVDDDTQFVGMLSQILEDEGYSVESFEAVKFTQTYQEVKPDVLVIDVWFGDETDGIRLSQALANHRELHDIPLLLVSSDPQIAQYAKEVRADDFLQKPFDIPDMLQKIEQLVS
jgi:two-component system, OmpR family, response regulator VicR